MDALFVPNTIVPNTKFLKTATAALLCTLSLQAHALDDQWYLGIGGGISGLTPNPENDAIDRSDDQGAVGTLFLGRDFDNRSSGQLQLFSLGESEFDNDDTAAFAAIEAAVLYRFYDTRDNQRGDGVFGASIYGRFGLGYLNRDSDLDLNTESSAYFGVGGGVETYFTNNVGVRAEFQFFDTDAVAGTLSLVGRFGGLRRDQARRPPPVTSQVTPFPTREDVTQQRQQAQQAPDSNTTAVAPQAPQTAPLPAPAPAPFPAPVPSAPQTAATPQYRRYLRHLKAHSCLKLPWYLTMPSCRRFISHHDHPLYQLHSLRLRLALQSILQLPLQMTLLPCQRLPARRI